MTCPGLTSQRPLAERRELLHKSFVELPNEFQFAKASDAADVEAIQEFLNESVVGNCEGLMVKTLDVDATYVLVFAFVWETGEADESCLNAAGMNHQSVHSIG